jgi:3-methyl-2-oxobutanoate hydroxymethyltransferase
MSAQPPVARGDHRPKSTVLTFRDKRQRGEPITVLTAYDYPTARAVEDAGADAILVGDSLAMVVLGHPNTLSVTLDEMLHHARAVSRGAHSPLLIGDLPFMSYQAAVPDAVRSAGRFLQEGGMDAVKLEGGRAFAPTAAAIVRAGIPVQGHIGLTPQSVHAMGGFKVQGRTAEAARGLLEDALALEDAGCFSLVLEGMPERVADLITRRVRIPTIGIGAGRGTSGQVLVLHDILGLSEHAPRFVRRYAELGGAMVDAATAFRHDVTSGAFPGPEHTYTLPDEEWQAFLESIGEVLPETSPTRA